MNPSMRAMNDLFIHHRSRRNYCFFRVRDFFHWTGHTGRAPCRVSAGSAVSGGRLTANSSLLVPPKGGPNGRQTHAVIPDGTAPSLRLAVAETRISARPSASRLGERNVFCEYCIHTNIRKLEHTVKNQYICVYG